MKLPRVIACDIDGTIVNDDRVMSKETIEIFEYLHTKGVLIGIASGRPFNKSMIKHFNGWNLSFNFDFIIGMNGGQIYDSNDDKLESFNDLDKKYVRESIMKLKNYHDRAAFYIYGDNSMICSRIDDLMEASAIRNAMPLYEVPLEEIMNTDCGKIMVKGEPDVISEIAEEFKQYNCEHYRGFLTQPVMFEIQDPSINKGDALVRFCKKRNIDLKDVWAFGDTSNDNELLKTAGLGVCMINGTDDTKACADMISEYSNNEDGFARFIKKALELK